MDSARQTVSSPVSRLPPSLSRSLRHSILFARLTPAPLPVTVCRLSAAAWRRPRLLSMIYRLIVLTGPLTGQRITIEQSPMTLGRDADCTVPLPDPEAALKHAVIEHRAEGGLRIRDLGSMNRTLVNNREVREARLKHGDEIELGRTRFVVQAIVQAEVTPEPRRRRGPGLALTLGAIVVLVLGAIASFWRPRETPPSAQPPAAHPLPAAATSAVPVAETPGLDLAAPPGAEGPPVDDRIREMREEIEGLRETMQEIAERPVTITNVVVTSPSNPPVIVVVTAEPPPSVSTTRPSTPVASAPRPGLAVVRIASLDQRKFLSSDEFDEMRMVTAAITLTTPGARIEPGGIRVEIQFYDERKGGGILASPDILPPKPVTLDGAWAWSEPKTADLSYVVPKGARERQARAGRESRYYGYIVRVFHRDRLQDVDAQPKTLLDQFVSPAAAREGAP